MGEFVSLGTPVAQRVPVRKRQGLVLGQSRKGESKEKEENKYRYAIHLVNRLESTFNRKGAKAFA